MSKAVNEVEGEVVGGGRLRAFAKREIGRVLALGSLVVIFIFFTIGNY